MLDVRKKLRKELYQNLGKVFYAVAMADRKVHPKEIEKLKELVRDHWLEVDAIEDEYGSDAAFQIETVFDWALKHEKESEEVYAEFEAFYKDHTTHFTPKVKQLIATTAKAITSAFAGRNKSELILLGRIELLLNA